MMIVDEKRAAQILALRVQTLRNWRYQRKGPPYIKVGRRTVRYLEEDLQNYLKQGRIEPGK